MEDVPRYAAGIPFPPYRYVPGGGHPHPTSDPGGHLFGREREPAAPPDAESWTTCEEYLYGVDLYNHGYWWEAHEAWEGLWQQVERESDEGLFLQGLIQAAAAMLKWHMGQSAGTCSLLSAAIGKLSRVRARSLLYMGLDLDPFLAAASRALEEARGGRPISPAWIPAIRLMAPRAC